MAHKGFKTDERIIVTVKDLLQGRLKKIKYKKGFSNKDVVTDHGTTSVYAAVLFKLLELMIMDVIDGHIVYFNRRLKARFYVDWQPVSASMIAGKGITENMKTPLVDFKVSGYKMPLLTFDPGYKNSTPCQLFVPSYLYAMLIEKVNEGFKYTKGIKEYWFNKKK